MKKIIFSTILLLALTLATATDFLNYIDENINEENYPNASAVNIFTEVTLEINKDLSYSSHVKYIKKIMNYKGKKRYSDIKLTYNKDFETIELGDCYTLTADGRRVDIPEEAFHDSEYFMTVLSPDYIRIWEKAINYSEIIPGNYIVLEYTKNNNDKRFVSGIEYMKDENPYLEKTFIVKYPESLNIFADVLEKCSELSMKEKRENGFIYKIFTVKNTQAVQPEYNAPNKIYTNCPIVYSNENDWTKAGNKIFAEFKSGMEVSEAVSEKALELTKNLKTDEEKIRALYKFTAEEFTTKYSDFMSMSFKPLPVDETFDRRYGSDRDLVALFIAMAQAVGIKDCYPALVLEPAARFEDFQEEYVLPAQINSIAAFWNNNIISPGSSSKPFGYGFDCNLLIGKKKPELIKYSYDKNFTRKKVACNFVGGNEYNLDYEIEFSGNGDFRTRTDFRNETAEKTKIKFDNKQTDKSSVLSAEPKFENLNDLNKNVILTYSQKNIGFINEQKNYAYLSLPLEKIHLNVGAEKRSLPFYISSPISVEEEFVIENIPEKQKIIQPEKDLNEQFKIGDKKLKCSIKISRKGDNLVFRRKVFIPSGIVPVDKYAEFRRIINSLNNPANKVIFMKKS
ncbi:MAG: hypothetical protein CSB55_00410 [Candidatus Cloacimonadota bacterium]|nr:MAG: hypothetical protein CSB55_00410 [Candidatus Cloacimonadota bacterium]